MFNAFFLNARFFNAFPFTTCFLDLCRFVLHLFDAYICLSFCHGDAPPIANTISKVGMAGLTQIKHREGTGTHPRRLFESLAEDRGTRRAARRLGTCNNDHSQEMAGGEMTRRHLAIGHGLGADRLGERAARSQAAAGRNVDRARDLAGE